MLKHHGIRRTHLHNVRLAILLSLTAGFVNAEGFLAFSVLTTNVTGHAALFAEYLSIKAWSTSLLIALWMLLFLAGAFVSSFIIDIIGKNQRYSNLLPISLEFLILATIGLIGNHYSTHETAGQVFAGALLFAMGLQNSLVSMISRSVVRTTHLTGTFTDLGIELAQLKFTQPEKKTELKSRIWLRIFIIVSFIAGAIFGAFAYRKFSYPSFLIPAGILVFALLFDVLRVNAKIYLRKIEHRIKKAH